VTRWHPRVKISVEKRAPHPTMLSRIHRPKSVLVLACTDPSVLLLPSCRCVCSVRGKVRVAVAVSTDMVRLWVGCFRLAGVLAVFGCNAWRKLIIKRTPERVKLLDHTRTTGVQPTQHDESPKHSWSERKLSENEITVRCNCHPPRRTLTCKANQASSKCLHPPCLHRPRW
jgi:hypothetical protein